jgi:hypothetical protein
MNPPRLTNSCPGQATDAFDLLDFARVGFVGFRPRWILLDFVIQERLSRAKPRSDVGFLLDFA